MGTDGRRQPVRTRVEIDESLQAAVFNLFDSGSAGGEGSSAVSDQRFILKAKKRWPKKRLKTLDKWDESMPVFPERWSEKKRWTFPQLPSPSFIHQLFTDTV